MEMDFLSEFHVADRDLLEFINMSIKGDTIIPFYQEAVKNGWEHERDLIDLAKSMDIYNGRHEEEDDDD